MSRLPRWLPLLALPLAGCTRTPPAPPAPPPVVEPPKTVAEQLARYCRVCLVDHPGGHEEYLPSRLDVDVDGRVYRFCGDACRAKFDADRATYLLEPED